MRNFLRRRNFVGRQKMKKLSRNCLNQFDFLSVYTDGGVPYNQHCPMNETWTECTPCEEACEFTFPTCIFDCNSHGYCGCKPRYVRYQNTCVLPADCPKMRQFFSFCFHFQVPISRFQLPNESNMFPGSQCPAILQKE